MDWDALDKTEWSRRSFSQRPGGYSSDLFGLGGFW